VIVVDTNVVSYALIQGPFTALARQVRKADPVWRLPELWKHEYLNVLVTYIRTSGLEAKTALRLWNQADEMLSGLTVSVDNHLAIRLAVEKKIGGYDAQFVANSGCHW
jgi:predicted nucleic acid-binding protein